jgi:two-component system C4-dicarboxylate transport sensor histidine kinase DctB
MIEATELGASICQDLLTFGREDHPSAAAPPVPIQTVVDRSLRLLRHDLKKRGIEVEAHIAKEAVVGCHEARLVQVFVNLISNSLEALQDQPPANCRISVDARVLTDSPKGGAEVAIVFEDNGPGIPADVRHLVFQPLFTTKGKHGNGLGLSVCKQIVEEYGGRISVEAAPAGGTQVLIRLPLAVE